MEFRFFDSSHQIVSSEFFNGQKMTERAVWSFLHWEWFDPCSSRRALSSSSTLLVEERSLDWKDWGLDMEEMLLYRFLRKSSSYLLFSYFSLPARFSHPPLRNSEQDLPRICSPPSQGLHPPSGLLYFFCLPPKPEADCFYSPSCLLLVGWLVRRCLH